MSKNDDFNMSSMKLLLINRTLVVVVGNIIPPVVCFTSVIYIYIFEFHRIEKSMIPDCPGTNNLFPPISYIIGVWEPTRTIWFCVMFISFPARLMYPIFYNYLYKRSNSKHADSQWYKILNQFLTFSLIVESFALVILTIFDVAAQFRIHATAFGTMLISFVFNMIFSAILYYFSGESKNSPNWLFNTKLILCVAAFILSLTTPFTYFYSTIKCEQLTYALFSLTEYILVLINSSFYILLLWDCPNISIELTGN